MPDTAEFKIVVADDVPSAYDEHSDVLGEFRSLTDALGSQQIAITLIRIPPHSDFEQGTGHFHDETEELYLVGRGTLTMRFGDEVHEVGEGSVVRVAPKTTRSHRNESGETVELWAISKVDGMSDATKVDEFWQESDQAKQTRSG